jgi:hypothetical protein
MKSIIVLAFFVSMPSFAHRLGGCCDTPPEAGGARPRFVAEEVGTGGEMTASELTGLLMEAHDVFEHHGHEVDTSQATRLDRVMNFLKDWAEKFDPENAYNTLLNNYRWYSSNRKRPEIENAAANIVAMFLTSHSIETIGGLSLSAFGAEQDSDILKIVLTTVGVTITIPFFGDPLCWTLVAAYSKWPRTLNRWMTVPRLFVVHGSSAALGALGTSVPEGYFQMKAAELAKQLFIRRLKARHKGIYIRDLRETHALFRIFDGAGEHVDLGFEWTRGMGMNLKTLEFSSTRLYGEDLRRNLAPFGVSIRDLVLDLIYNYKTSAPYVESNVRDEEMDRRYIRVKQGAFPFHAFQQAECETLLED